MLLVFEGMYDEECNVDILFAGYILFILHYCYMELGL
jgi:hypothetical protein